MRTGVQFTGSLAPNASGRWFTFGWPVGWHVIWYGVPTSVRNGAPSIEWSVAVERASSTDCTYWITFRNITNVPVTFEARYAVLN